MPLIDHDLSPPPSPRLKAISDSLQSVKERLLRNSSRARDTCQLSMKGEMGRDVFAHGYTPRAPPPSPPSAAMSPASYCSGSVPAHYFSDVDDEVTALALPPSPPPSTTTTTMTVASVTESWLAFGDLDVFDWGRVLLAFLMSIWTGLWMVVSFPLATVRDALPERQTIQDRLSIVLPPSVLPPKPVSRPLPRRKTREDRMCDPDPEPPTRSPELTLLIQNTLLYMMKENPDNEILLSLKPAMEAYIA